MSSFFINPWAMTTAGCDESVEAAPARTDDELKPLPVELEPVLPLLEEPDPEWFEAPLELPLFPELAKAPASEPASDAGSTTSTTFPTFF